MARATRRKKPIAPSTGCRMLALDVSSVAVGWAVFDGQELGEYGKYRQEGKEHGEHLMHFGAWLLEVLAAYKPDYMVVEMPYAGRRRYTYGVLMMYFGAVIRAHFEHFGFEMPTEDRVAAHAVKRLLEMPKGSDHENRKRMMVNEINWLYGLNLKFKAKDKTKKVSDDDIADAIAVGRARLIRQGKEGGNKDQS